MRSFIIYFYRYSEREIKQLFCAIFLSIVFIPCATYGDTLKIAFWNIDLYRKGPGIALRDILRQKNSDVKTVTTQINALNADIWVLSGLDYDAESKTVSALNQNLATPYPHVLALRPNVGIPTGLDLDGNGYTDGANDAQAYGFFPGQGGMAILSRLPINYEDNRNFSLFLWKDLPEAQLPPLPESAKDILRLSSNGHYETSVLLENGQKMQLLSWHASTPAFDGKDNRNGKRNHDENAFWLKLLASELAFPPPKKPFILIGQANIDPKKGEGDPSVINKLIFEADLQDPLAPFGETVDYGKSVGPLRVAYILPSQDIKVIDAGHLPPIKGARHKPIWIKFSTTP